VTTIRRHERGATDDLPLSVRGFTVVDFDDTHLEQAVQLWEDAALISARPVFALAEVLASVTARDPALVVVRAHDGRLTGAIASRVDRERAWVLRWAVSADARRAGIGSLLLRTLERRLRALGVRELSLLAPEGMALSRLLGRRGYIERDSITLFEKRQLVRDPHDQLDEIGARRIPPECWDAIGGMDAEKDLIERRIILPLREQGVAREHGVVPASAVLLFGPPGTGKTTFAKAIAARLAWPFVEIFPSQLAAEHQHGRAHVLRSLFDRLSLLDQVVVFIDEVEDVASHRRANPDNLAVANELLKLIPDFRESEGRLLICATNSMRDLDPAFTRPGRFDYIVPVPPPDRQARHAIWASYARTIPHVELDLDELAVESELFAPADIEYAFKLGCQAAFERSVHQGKQGAATTNDYLSAVQAMRPSVSQDSLRAFEEDIRAFARF
jgi:ATP-dependent 26S proteasome regulatory subunit